MAAVRLSIQTILQEAWQTFCGCARRKANLIPCPYTECRWTSLP